MGWRAMCITATGWQPAMAPWQQHRGSAHATHIDSKAAGKREQPLVAEQPCAATTTNLRSGRQAPTD
eukprot:12060368-Alexandrium_andersonii.AAC.1